MKAEYRKENRRWDLSKNKKVIFDLTGVLLIESDEGGEAVFSLSHTELKNLNRLRKKYNFEFKDELAQERALEDIEFIGNK